MLGDRIGLRVDRGDQRVVGDVIHRAERLADQVAQQLLHLGRHRAQHHPRRGCQERKRVSRHGRPVTRAEADDPHHPVVVTPLDDVAGARLDEAYLVCAFQYARVLVTQAW